MAKAQRKPKEVNEDTNNGNGQKKARLTNPLLLGLTKEMRTSPFLIETGKGRSISSDNLILEKFGVTIGRKLEYGSKEEFIDHISKWWDWEQTAPDRKATEEADRLFAEATADPRILERLRERMRAFEGGETATTTPAGEKQKAGAKN